MSEDQIEKIHTPCLGCYFAQWDNKTQIDCSANILSKYNQVLPVHDDEEREFFVINGRQCNFKRPNSWAVGLGIEKAIQKVRQELAIKAELVIYTPVIDIELIKQTINSGIQQDIPVAAISVINHTDDISQDLSDCVAGFGLPWKVKHILDDEASKRRCFDFTIKESKYPYFLSCEAGYIVPNIISKIDDVINGNLEQVVATSIDKGKAILGQVLTYKILQGNAGEYSFWEKLMEIEKEEGKKLTRVDTEL